MTSETNTGDDALSAVFSIVKSLFDFAQSGVLQYAQVEAAVLKKGYTADQLKICLADYQDLGVLTISDDDSEIMLVQ